jgi:hypothetical protein
MDCLTGFCAGKSKQYQLARRDSNPDEENQNLSCYQLHHGLRIETQEKAFQTAGILPLSMSAINGVVAHILSGRNLFSRISRSLSKHWSLLAELPWSQPDHWLKKQGSVWLTILLLQH